LQKISEALINNAPPVRRYDSSDNIRTHIFNKKDINKNKSESPDMFNLNNNIYQPNFNYINNVNNLSHSNSFHVNLNSFNHKKNNIINNDNFGHNQLNNNIYMNNAQNLNLMNNNNFHNMNIINNTHSINNIHNLNYNSNSNHNSNKNLNLSYNISPNNLNIKNDSMEEVYSYSRHGKESFNSCPSMHGNHLSFNTTTDTNNNYNNSNYINNNSNNFNNNYSNNENQNILSMQKLFLNLNPYTATLVRNNEGNMNQFLHNDNSQFNFNNPNFYNYNNFNNMQFNNFRASLFNANNMTHLPKKSLSTKGFHTHMGHLGFNNNNFNNINNNINNISIDGNISNDNLSHSSIGSSKAQLKKKRTSLFQNGLNKEKDLKDFKRFCDGLKTSMDEYICTQIGSRIMQKYLKKFPSYIRTLLINKISIYFEKLMCDTYGNYFCQKLYNISELEQRLLILNSLKNSFLTISKNNCGAHAIQFIIGAAQETEEKKLIIDYVSNHELELSLDPEGTHIIQKIVSCFKENERENLNNVLLIPDNIKSLCLNGKGMCIMKKLIISTEDKDNKMKILNGIYKHYIEIVQSPFGNYIIQNIFEEWDINICIDLVQACIKDALTFATQKYSSNVIVKIIDLYQNNNKLYFNFIEQVKTLFFDTKNIMDLYNNKYGRLLLYKLNGLIPKEEKEKLVRTFQKNVDDIKIKEKIDILTEIFG